MTNILNNKSLLLIVNFLLLTTFSFAQKSDDADPRFGLGFFNNRIFKVQVLPDGKILAAGDFFGFKNYPLKSIIRLNKDGSLDESFNAGSGARLSVRCFAVQKDGKIIIGGTFTSFNGTPCGYITRLHSDGTTDNSFNVGSGFTSYVHSIAIQKDDKIVIGGAFWSFNGTNKRFLVRLNPDGSMDNDFSEQEPNNAVHSVCLQSDDKILIGGAFNSYGFTEGGPTTLVGYLARLNADGTLDNTISGVMGSIVNAIEVQPDQKIIVGGHITRTNFFEIVNNVIRLNPDGTTDSTFDVGTGPDSEVFSIAVQQDGKILIGGIFNTFNGLIYNNLARVNNDGTIDHTFNFSKAGFDNTSEDSYIRSIAIQTDGQILVAGQYNQYNHEPANNLVRVHPDGKRDNTFDMVRGTDLRIYAMKTQLDGKVIIAGAFNSYNGVHSKGLVRINDDGSIDNTFKSGTGFNGVVYCVAIQPNGKIILGGSFSEYNGVPFLNLIRLNKDGTIDPTFKSGFSYSKGIYVYSLALQPDGKIIVGGDFGTNLNPSQENLVRIFPDGSKDNSFKTGIGPNGAVKAIEIQKDGNILIGGDFTSISYQSAPYFARLTSTGSIDKTFVIPYTITAFNDMALLKDGKIILGATLWIPQIKVKYLGRFNSDGSEDIGFNSGIGPNSQVGKIEVLENGQLIITGDGTLLFNPDGTRDLSFKGTGGPFEAITELRDGRILFGGLFSRYEESTHNNILCLQGSLIPSNKIRGNIFIDGDNNCNHDINDTGIPSVIVKSLPGPHYGFSNERGAYYINVDTGSVTHIVKSEFNIINSKLFNNRCTSSYNVSMKGTGEDTCCIDFATDVKECALLNVSIQNTRMRRCFKNYTYVTYCNYGNIPSSNTQLKVSYPKFVIPLSSIPEWTSREGSVLIYDLGTVNAEFCGKIIITDSVICGDESIRGLTQCIKAEILPSSDCESENSSWDKSSIIVSGSCQNSVAIFSINNTGIGNMPEMREYRVFMKDTLIYKSTFILNSGESLSVRYPAMGKTIRLEADQHILHPGKSRPMAIVEDCGANLSGANERGYITTASQNDLDDEIAVTCNPIIDSYDPNDKQVIPSGTGLTKRIKPGTELEYIIRFQNTGSDTAYRIKIIDTLDMTLDAASFIQGSSSHPYRLEISGKGNAVLTYIFENINLPDSAKNEAASHGLVSFRITVPTSAPEGTVIRNKAYIYFDYNSPIITNEATHTISSLTDVDYNKGNLVQVGLITGVEGTFRNAMKVYPNPSSGLITLEIPIAGNDNQLKIFSILGHEIKSVDLSKELKQEIHLEEIEGGLYIYEIWQDAEQKTTGLLKIH